MDDPARRAIAIVGVSAILPDAPDARSFWQNLLDGRYSISEVPPGRWDPELYYDPDPSVPDKCYSKIGGWVREFEWEPMKWRLPIPPRVADAMDVGQQWAVAGARACFADYGMPDRELDLDRTAVVLGNAMAGEQHYLTALRIHLPRFERALAGAPSFAALPDDVRRAVADELRERFGREIPQITEDTMPGELANCAAGRIANLFDLHGPNFVCDAACAAALSAIDAAAEGLVEEEYDAVLVGGVDRNMGPEPFVKFCKIGALSATGTRPYADGADGFVMGEGAAFFLLKRLVDAERAGDRVYAVLRGVGGASDGKGKGITAPNPKGQRLAIERAWRIAGLSPGTCGLVEGHGTSTRVGDVVEVQSLNEVFGPLGLPPRSVPLGSVKSNIGHLKGAAGAAGLLKAVFALSEKTLPPSLHCEQPNPNIDWDHTPFFVNSEARPWDAPQGGVRRAGVSAFGFGGTNFHAVLDEHVPGRLTRSGTSVSVPGRAEEIASRFEPELKAPLRGALVLGARSAQELGVRLDAVIAEAAAGRAPAPAPPAERDLRAPERIALEFGDAAELASRAERAKKALASDLPNVWAAVRAQGVFRGRGEAPKVAFLYTGQGSQYPNMLRALREREPLVAAVFEEADRVMAPYLERPLSSYLFPDPDDADAVARAAEELKRTEITQPAVLTVDVALTRLLAAYGIVPDLVMGHSLGEYGALVASGALPFEDALLAVSARGREMADLEVEDRGLMAAVFGPLEQIRTLVESTPGEVVVANINSTRQAVIGGATEAVTRAIEAFTEAGLQTVPLPVSHAFHTSIVAPASEPLRRTLEGLRLAPPEIPLVANVDGRLYPTGPDAVPRMLDLLAAQVASPVQFVEGLETLYDEGARVFVEVGPKRALQGFTADVLGDRPDAVPLFTNHPKTGDLASFNQALCGLYAAGHGVGAAAETRTEPAAAAAEPRGEPAPQRAPAREAAAPPAAGADDSDRLLALGRLFAGVLEEGERIWRGGGAAAPGEAAVVTGAGLGLPGRARVFADDNVERILEGAQGIDVIPQRFRRAIVDKHITRLVKSDGEAHFETLEGPAESIKLAARAGALDLQEEFGIPAERVAALDLTTQLAVGAGLEALRDAGLPLVMHYRRTRNRRLIPERWMLPDALRDETGVIFASAFPGFDAFARELEGYHRDRALRERIALLEGLRGRMVEEGGSSESLLREVDHRLHELRHELEQHPYAFDRRFLFRVLPMAHAQFAEIVGARGPNTHVNSACASTTQAFALAEDWIHAGRCRRVVVIAGDDATSDHLLEWMGAGFLSTGAAATDEVVEEAAVPFDRRRHGMLLGMGAAGFVIEEPACARERGLRPVCEVLSAVTANSAFHGTRLDVDHIRGVMEELVARAEHRFGLDRRAMAREMVFVSHETYTPARGGSAAAEVNALRAVFGEEADRIVVANTKGLTGHPMGVGVEDAVAVKALETGLVPPVPNFREADPELGALHLSRGGAYPVRYALRLGAGFGSQISMTLLRWAPSPDGRRPEPDALGHASRVADPAVFRAWLRGVSGDPQADLETVHRTLRVVDRGPAARAASEPAAAGPTVATAEPAAPRPAPEPLAAAPAPGDDPVRAQVLEIVSRQTGYPVEMLDVDLDLEADLGIDTVKQAETFAAIREAWGIPRDPDLKLRDYPTLAHAVQFVRERRPDLAAPTPAASPAAEPSAPPAAPAAAAARAAGSDPDAIRERVLAIVSEKTGYPAEMLEVDLDLEADLGIDTVKQAETFAALREAWDIPRDPDLKLRDYPTLAHAIAFVRERMPAAGPEASGASASAPGAPSAPTPPTPEPAAPAAADDEAEIRERVLAIVAEKTGYPAEMLELDLDLEADLGIDTVKQAETFAAIREAWGIPRDPDLKLRDYPTLAHAVRFVRERRPDLAGLAVPTPASDAAGTAPETAAAATAPLLAGDDEAAARLPRRVPVPVLRPPRDACRETGVSLGAGDRVLLAPDAGGAGAALAARLEERGVEVLEIDPAGDHQAAAEAARAFAAGGAVRGVYWLAALDDEGPLASLTSEAWHQALHARARLPYTVLRELGDAVGTPGSFLVSATRLGGRHGYGREGATAPLGGATAGFTKAWGRERPEALAKVVDFAAGAAPDDVAEALLGETLRDPGAVEIGIDGTWRLSVALCERPLEVRDGLDLGPDSVFAVTGAAGGIVSAIVADLAAACGGTFHLFDVVPEPDPDDEDVALLARDREALQRRLFERMRAAGQRATPAAVEREILAVERRASAVAALAAVRAAGGRAHWHALDLRDAKAVDEAVQALLAESGRVDAMVLAAGLEKSRALADKEPDEFDLVFDVKADGAFHLLRALGDVPPRAVVAFSSIAGRFGNAGQTDYSAANDLLCKIVSGLRRTHPDTRALAIDWTAWSQIGMATRGSIPAVMERAGIEMLPARAGIPVVRRELRAGSRGELLVGGRLGVLVDEPDPTGGVLPEALSADDAGPMTGRVTGLSLQEGLRVAVRLDPTAQPFLDHHRIEGTPVLPGVMGLEAFAEAARRLAPGFRVVGFEDVAFDAAFKLYRDEPREAEILARFEWEGASPVVDARLVGRRRLPGRDAPQETLHFRARVLLARDAPPAESAPLPGSPPATAVGADAIYRIYFHGPAYRVLDACWRHGDAVVGRMPEDLPPGHAPAEAPLAAAPRLLELCFQTAGVREIGATGRLGLPHRIARVSLAGDASERGGPFHAVATAREDGGADAVVVDAAGRALARLEGYRTVPLPEAVDEALRAPLREAVER